MKEKRDTSRYAARGVSSGKEAVHKATAGLDKGLFPGAFCPIFPDIAGNLKYGSIQHADGAGTKAGLAYLACIENFGRHVWAGIPQDSLVMNVDDVWCVGAQTGPMHITQIIDRNTFVISDEDVEAIITGCKHFCNRMNRLGFVMLYVSGETADVPDLIRTVTVSNVVSSRIKLVNVIDASRMRPGDAIVGFSSTGQAFWEDVPNAGGGSNGYTNMRHDTLAHYYAKFTESYAPQLKKTLVYRGKYRLTDPLPGDSRFSIGSALLSPTRTYLPLIKKLLELASPEDIHGLIHCSGGGQTKIGKFGDPENLYIKDKPFPVPPLFAMVKKVSGLTWKAMFKACNMGHRLEAVVPKRVVEACFEAAAWAGIEARCVGRVERRSLLNKRRVVIRGPAGEFSY